jgi:hypothetical protein
MRRTLYSPVRIYGIVVGHKGMLRSFSDIGYETILIRVPLIECIFSTDASYSGGLCFKSQSSVLTRFRVFVFFLSLSKQMMG